MVSSITGSPTDRRISSGAFLTGDNYIDSLDGGLQRWAHFPLHVYLNRSASCTPRRVNSIVRGFSQWVNRTRGWVRFDLVDTPADADVLVRCDIRQGRSVTDTLFDPSTETIARANICIGLRDPDHPGRIVNLEDTQCLAAHEFGHALGINGHSDSPRDLMYPTLDNNREITERDLCTLAAAYTAIE